MNPKELFNKGLTESKHELGELHYVGESLPVPNQIFDGVNNSASSVGESPIPAREDHVHNIDLSNYYTIAEVDAAIAGVEVDLSAYYTSAQVDTLLTSYYTSAQVDALFSALDYYTQAEVDALVASVGGGPNDFAWSYDELVVDPSVTSFGDIWYPPGSVTITEMYATCASADSSNDFIITLWVGGVNSGSFIFASPDTTETTGIISVAANALTDVTVSVAKDGSFTGDMEGLMIVVRYEF